MRKIALLTLLAVVMLWATLALAGANAIKPRQRACDTLFDAQSMLRNAETQVCAAFGYNQDDRGMSGHGGGCASCTAVGARPAPFSWLIALTMAMASLRRYLVRNDRRRVGPRVVRQCLVGLGLVLCCTACQHRTRGGKPPKAVLVPTSNDVCHQGPVDRHVSLVSGGGGQWAHVNIGVNRFSFGMNVFAPRDAGASQFLATLTVNRMGDVDPTGRSITYRASTFEGRKVPLFKLGLFLMKEGFHEGSESVWLFPAEGRTSEQRVPLSAGPHAFGGTLVVASGGSGFSVQDDTGVTRVVVRLPTRTPEQASTGGDGAAGQENSTDGGDGGNGKDPAIEVVHTQGLAIACGGPHDLELQILAKKGAPWGTMGDFLQP